MNTDNNSSKFKDITDWIIEKYLNIPQLPDPKQYRVAETLHTLSTIILLIGYCYYRYHTFCILQHC